MAVLTLGADSTGWSAGAAPVQLGGYTPPPPPPPVKWNFGSLGLPSAPLLPSPQITLPRTTPTRLTTSPLTLGLERPGITGEGPKVPKPPNPKNLGFLLLLIIILPGLFGK